MYNDDTARWRKNKRKKEREKKKKKRLKKKRIYWVDGREEKKEGRGMAL